MASDEELDAIRQRRLLEMQQQAQARGQHDAEAQIQQAEAEAQRQTILRQVLTPEARQRLAAVAMARRQLARNVEDHLVSLAVQGRLRGQVTEDVLRQLLQQLDSQRKETRIRRLEK